MIYNLHILTRPDDAPEPDVKQLLIKDHRRGKHSEGGLHQDCPLCQLGK